MDYEHITEWMYPYANSERPLFCFKEVILHVDKPVLLDSKFLNFSVTNFHDNTDTNQAVMISLLIVDFRNITLIIYIS